MGSFMEQMTTIALAIVSLAVVAVIVSRNAQTPAVIGAAGQAFAGAIGAAVSPVVGSGFTAGASPGYLGIQPGSFFGQPGSYY